MLATSNIIAAALPNGFYSAVVLEILLSLYILEDDARYLLVDQLVNKPGGAATVTKRWLAVLVEQDYVEQRHGLAALTTKGFASVDQLMQTVYNLQRDLD